MQTYGPAAPSERKTCFFERAAVLSPLVLAVFVWPHTAVAQIAFDASTSSGSPSNTMLSWSHTVGAGQNRLLVVGVSNAANNPPAPSSTSVTYAGHGLTRQVINDAGIDVVEIWTLVAPPSGTATVTVTLSGPTPVVGGSVSFTGVDQNTPIRATNHSGGSGLMSLTVSTSVTTAPGDMVIDAVAGNVLGIGAGGSAAAGQTERWNRLLVVGLDLGGGSTQPGAAGSTTMSWTISGDIVRGSIAAVSLIPAPTADISVTTTGPASVIAGNNITYTVNVANNGPNDAQNVTLSDTLPVGTTFVSETQTSGPAFTCTNPPVGGMMTCTLATLANGASASFTLVLKVPASVANGSTITNTATVSSAVTDPNPNNNGASSSATVGASADLSITKIPPAAVTFNTNLNYTITVSNAGPSNSQNVVVTDAIPSNTSFVSAVPSQGSCSGTAMVTCSLGTINAGSSATITLMLKLNSGNSVTNTASVTADTADPNLANNSSTTAAIPVTPLPSSLILILAGLGILVLYQARRWLARPS
jgi:uncharacterized repeat protein (TIGR01451 family)